MFSLQDKIAVITGGASGFGKATGIRFAAAGANVVLADINDASGIAKEIGGLYVKTDVTREESVKHLMEEANQQFGKIHIVVNNAGVFSAVCDIQSLSEEELDKELNVNTKAVIWGIKHSLGFMTEGGCILNTASYAGLVGVPYYTAYVASKSAIIGITKAAALELAPMGIRVNCICPGTCETPMSYVEGAEAELAVSSMIQPLGRLGKPEEIAALYHFLASDDCTFLTGAAIPVDGGMSAGFSMGALGVLYEKATGGNLNDVI